MKVSFHTLGCKTNAYETQAIREQMEAAGWQIGDFTESCDVYVINTCAVTREAARKSRQMTGRCKRLNPQALVVVTGCYAQEAGEKLLTETGADLVVGNSEKNHILPMVTEWIEKDAGAGENLNTRHFQTSGLATIHSIYAAEADPAEPISDTDYHETPDPANRLCLKDLTHWREYEPQTITGQAGHVRVYVKIQDGCDRFCSYCLIPYLRGRSRSRDPEDILREASGLAAGGCKEIVLTGIDISSFHFPEGASAAHTPLEQGRGTESISLPQTDIRKEQKKDHALAQLISRLGDVPGIERIRLGSLEESLVTPEFLETVRNVQAFCPHFHLSLQSGSDGVLKRMNRHYTTQQYKEAVELIRSFYPDAGITTDIIAGFPGETKEEFEETLRFVQEIRFSRIHVFPYSRRNGTKADRLPGQLTRAVKDERTAELIRIGNSLQQAYEQKRIGTICRILAEECFTMHDETGGPEVCLAGYTPEYVRITAFTNLTEAAARQLVGSILAVRPLYQNMDGLSGKIILPFGV